MAQSSELLVNPMVDAVNRFMARTKELDAASSLLLKIANCYQSLLDNVVQAGDRYLQRITQIDDSLLTYDAQNRAIGRTEISPDKMDWAAQVYPSILIRYKTLINDLVTFKAIGGVKSTVEIKQVNPSKFALVHELEHLLLECPVLTNQEKVSIEVSSVPPGFVVNAPLIKFTNASKATYLRSEEIITVVGDELRVHVNEYTNYWNFIAKGDANSSLLDHSSHYYQPWYHGFDGHGVHTGIRKIIFKVPKVLRIGTLTIPLAPIVTVTSLGVPVISYGVFTTPFTIPTMPNDWTVNTKEYPDSDHAELEVVLPTVCHEFDYLPVTEQDVNDLLDRIDRLREAIASAEVLEDKTLSISFTPEIVRDSAEIIRSLIEMGRSTDIFTTGQLNIDLNVDDLPY